MAHFAKIDNNNIVTQVLVSEQDFINSGVVGDSFLWIQTSYNNSFKKQYAAVGSTYDKTNNQFVASKPYASWTLDSDNDWQPPVTYPSSGNHRWDENTTNWTERD